MRESSRFVEVAVEKTGSTPAMRVSSRFIEVAVKNPKTTGWTVGAIRIA